MAETNLEDAAMATEAPMAPITAERKVRSDLEDSLAKPCVFDGGGGGWTVVEAVVQDKGGVWGKDMARALACPDTEQANGTPGRDNRGMTVLQQHASFFDQNNDGIIYPWETFRGLRALGLNLVISLLGAVIINAAFTYFTVPGWLPSLRLGVYIKNIHKGKHGSDSGGYDTEGRFIPVNLENMFSKYAITQPGKLTLRELWRMTEGNRAAADIVGGLLSKFEWGFVYIIARDDEGFVSKEDFRGLFDGSLFENVAAKNLKTKSS